MMSTANLPLELLLQIFRYLDARSFFAVRSVSRFWRLASTDTVTLRRLLEGLPMLPPTDVTKLSHQDLQSLFHDASSTLMLGLRPKYNNMCATEHRFAREIASLAGPKVLSSSRTHKAITVSARTITQFETSSWPPTLLAQAMPRRTSRDRPVAQSRIVVWLRACSVFKRLLISNGNQAYRKYGRSALNHLGMLHRLPYESHS